MTTATDITALLTILGVVALLGYVIIGAAMAQQDVPPEPQRGICPNCGYPLKADPTQCGECGEVWDVENPDGPVMTFEHLWEDEGDGDKIEVHDADANLLHPD